MSMLKRLDPKPTLDHYNNTTDSFLITLVKEMQENPDYDKITLLFKAAENRINAEQQSPFAKSIAEQISENREQNANWPETPEQARGMLDRCLVKYKELYPPLEMPVYTIVRNEKGLCEKNYVYTREQMEKLDLESLRECEARGMAESGFSANDTYVVSVIEDPLQLKDIMLGCDNHPNIAPDSDNYLETLESFYWETMTTCMFTGEPNPTAEHAIQQFKLSPSDLKGTAISNEIALDVGNGYVEIHLTLGDAKDFSIYDKTFNLIDGGLESNTSLSLIDVFRDIEKTRHFGTRHPIDINPEWFAEQVSYADKCRAELTHRGLAQTLHRVAELSNKYPELISVQYTPSSISVSSANSVRNPMVNVQIVPDDLNPDRTVKMFFADHPDCSFASKELITKAICTDIADMVAWIGDAEPGSDTQISTLARLYSRDFYESLDTGKGDIRDYSMSEDAANEISENRYAPEPKKSKKNDIEISH